MSLHDNMPETKYFRAINQIRMYTAYMQRSPCSMEFYSTSFPPDYLSPWTMLIVIHPIRVILITNSWYVREHPFFRNIPAECRQLKGGRMTSSILQVTNMDPKSVFILAKDEPKQFTLRATSSTTFYDFLMG